MPNTMELLKDEGTVATAHISAYLAKNLNAYAVLSIYLGTNTSALYSGYFAGTGKEYVTNFSTYGIDTYNALSSFPGSLDIVHTHLCQAVERMRDVVHERLAQESQGDSLAFTINCTIRDQDINIFTFVRHEDSIDLSYHQHTGTFHQPKESK